MSPSTTKQWTVEGKSGFDSLKLNESASIPKIGDKDVLVKINGASLNYRDLIMPLGKHPFPPKDGNVPGSDGAGVVESVGSKVTRFKPGDRVVTLFHPSHIAGPLDAAAPLATGLGGAIDGTLREYGVFDEQGLVAAPKNLNDLEASTLSCAGLTAWNALYGLESRALKPGHWVLTQGTGGVSIFALQFAKAAGARVIATTSSALKGETLRKLDADEFINYKETPNWGDKAKELTGGVGVQHVIEVGGPATMAQSLKAIAVDSVITIIGSVGGMEKDQPTFLDTLVNTCTVRGIVVGNRLQMQDMVNAIEANNIHPVVDEKVFEFKDLKEAYEYMWNQKHFGKLTIKVSA
ncbi:NAD(P)-binding protein [Plenodomus tracheiphilus IPT5]|uniref:NAD(P)-binding protein n=1 Tax=Plenodomus tracheiphilus IPT5 TaxID=1408161 RepID=A0A6A7BFN7_9PLEO|nr:NAD(P)-binding protein [Plenodomus tracheiphilus IPT5]